MGSDCISSWSLLIFLLCFTEKGTCDPSGPILLTSSMKTAELHAFIHINKKSVLLAHPLSSRRHISEDSHQRRHGEERWRCPVTNARAITDYMLLNWFCTVLSTGKPYLSPPNLIMSSVKPEKVPFLCFLCVRYHITCWFIGMSNHSVAD